MFNDALRTSEYNDTADTNKSTDAKRIARYGYATLATRSEHYAQVVNKSTLKAKAYFQGGY